MSHRHRSRSASHGYTKGHLEFELAGDKLAGRWHLIRMSPKPREKRENWLLIKADDTAARDEDAPDILEERPESAKTGRLAAEAVDAALTRNDPRRLAEARRGFMRQHGKVFLILRIMQHFWYGSDKRRERFVSICRDPDVLRLTWSSYLEKELVRQEFGTHLRIMMKDFAHLFGMITPWGTRP